MANINTNVVASFTEGARIRTLNYRGSLLSTLAVTPTINAVISENDLIYLCPIPYRSMIRSIRIGCTYSVGTTQAVFALTICGLKKDGKTIDNEIGFQAAIASIFTTSGTPLMTEKATSAVTGQTLMANLGTFTDGAFTPKAEFIPYKEDRLGILALKCTTTSSGAVTNGTITAIVDYVEPAPSDSPFLNTMGLTPKTV